MPKNKETQAYEKIKEVRIDDNGEKIYEFWGATTMPDRVAEILPDGTKLAGEILSKKALESISNRINDTTKMGGQTGAYRTISLFHNRVYEKDPSLEEAGFVVPNANVEPLPDYPGHWGIKTLVKVNKMYVPPQNYPDYTPEKIAYKIENGAIGLSIEYRGNPQHEKIVNVNGEKYRYVDDIQEFGGYGFARANLIGNPTAVAIKELRDIAEAVSQTEGGENMDTDKLVEIETKLAESEQRNKEMAEKFTTLEKSMESEKIKEAEAKMVEAEEKAKETKAADETLMQVKEAIRLGFESVIVKSPSIGAQDKVDMKIKEFKDAVEKKDWTAFVSAAEDKIKEQGAELQKALNKGINFEEEATLKVKCRGRGFVIEATQRTKDTIDNSSMNEAIYYQTNGMYADRYVVGITETFLMSDNLMKVLPKEQFVGGNDKFQWRIWTDFGTVTGATTAAVDPNVTAVATTKRNFLKLETPIAEYRDAVEVTDFTQHHSAGAVGDLLGLEIQRAAEYVTNSMNADLFKQYHYGVSSWVGLNGLLGFADSATYTVAYGRTRSAANRLLDATTANTYDTTAEAISASLVRVGYEKVLAHGANLSDLIIVMAPTQVRKLFDASDDLVRHNILTMAPADPSFGFKRDIIPYIDGVPIIRDYYCTDASGNQDTFIVVSVNPSSGFVLVVSKPLGIRGLAKVGTSEKSYVSFWGQSVLKNVLHVFLHDDLT